MKESAIPGLEATVWQKRSVRVRADRRNDSAGGRRPLCSRGGDHLVSRRNYSAGAGWGQPAPGEAGEALAQPQLPSAQYRRGGLRIGG